MSGLWKEVTWLAFRGERFRDHSLDLVALTELSHFQKMVSETARELWRMANPNRERLPKNFERRTRLCLRKIEPGSAIAPLEVYIEETDQADLFSAENGSEQIEINEAIQMAYRVLQAAERDEPLPENFPKSLLPEYEKWGRTLEEDEAIEVATNGNEPVKVSKISRARLANFIDRGQTGQLEVIGEVLEADVRQGKFQVWQDEKTCVTVPFSAEQEEKVTNALCEHRILRLRVIGKGEYSAQGKPLRITQIEELSLEPIRDFEYDDSVRPIEEVLSELAKEVPNSEWNKLPLDLTNNLDYYLYGSPK